jgi:hypothetical protein
MAETILRLMQFETRFMKYFRQKSLQGKKVENLYEWSRKVENIPDSGHKEPLRFGSMFDGE